MTTRCRLNVADQNSGRSASYSDIQLSVSANTEVCMRTGILYPWNPMGMENAVELLKGMGMGVEK